MSQSMGKGEIGGAAPNPKHMLAARDRSVAAVLGDKPAELIEWVRHSSQYGRYAPEWRARLAQLGAFLMLSESAVKRHIRTGKASGVLIVREVPEPMSYNGFALHFSVNAEALEAVKCRGREILQRRGWLDPQRAKATKGRNRPPVGKGSKGLPRPSVGSDCGPSKTLSSGKLKATADPLTSNSTTTSYKKNTHTGTATVASLPTPSARQRKKHEQDKETEFINLKEPPLSPPPAGPSDSSAASREDDAPPPLTDLVKRFEETQTLASLRNLWKDIAAQVHGAENVVPPTLGDRKIADDQFIPYCVDAKISLPKFLVWSVEKWDDLKENDMKWAKLEPYPTFRRIFVLKDKLLPYYLKAREEQCEDEDEDDPAQREAEEKTKAEVAKRETLARMYGTNIDYYKPEEVPANHPQRESILCYTRKGIPVRANSSNCVRLDDIELRERLRQQSRVG